MKSLVVYYSRTGNTKFVAEKIAQELGADIEEVIDKKNRSGKIGWLSAGKDAMQRNKTEIAETNKKPSEYDLIVVGTPNWVNKPSPAIRTYLSKYDLAGKRVATFCLTDGYSGGEKVIEEIRALIPNSDSNEHLVVSKPTENKTDTEKQNIRMVQQTQITLIRSRIPIHYDNRRNTTIPKTQIIPIPFLAAPSVRSAPRSSQTNAIRETQMTFIFQFSISIALKPSASRSRHARAPTHKNPKQQLARASNLGRKLEPCMCMNRQTTLNLQRFKCLRG